MNLFCFSILFSVLILPLNFLCIRWMHKRAFDLTGVTRWEYLKRTAQRETEEALEFTDEPPRYTDPEELALSKKTARMKVSQRKLVFFIHEHSKNPNESLRLLKLANACAFFGFAGPLLATYAGISHNPHKTIAILLCDTVLFLINLGIFVAGRIYNARHPLDSKLAEELHVKLEAEKSERNKAYIKAILVFVAFLGLMGGILYFVGAKPAQNSIQNTTPAFYIGTETVQNVLRSKGYETYEIPVTYWEYDEHKLMDVCAGIKGKSKLEFYDYSDSDTVDGVYNRIVYNLTADWEYADRDTHQAEMPGGGKRFHAILNGVHQLCIYREDVLIYAYSADGLDEINKILREIGFSEAE